MINGCNVSRRRFISRMFLYEIVVIVLDQMCLHGNEGFVCNKFCKAKLFYMYQVFCSSQIYFVVGNHRLRQFGMREVLLVHCLIEEKIEGRKGPDDQDKKDRFKGEWVLMGRKRDS